MNAILVGLSVNEKFPYKHNYAGCKLKASSILSFRTCTALDKLNYSISEDKNFIYLYWTQKT